VDAEVPKKPTSADRDHDQHPAEQRSVARPTIASELDDEDERRQQNEHERDHAMEAAGLGVGPRIDGTHDLATFCGIGAAVLRRAGVAYMGTGSVADEAPFTVEFVRPEVLALGTQPVVVGLVVDEAGGAVAQRAAVRVCGEPLERERRRGQRRRVDEREEGFGRHVILAAVASSSPKALTPSGSRTSVKRRSGSPSVTCLTV
jgi:hypothetical protein